MKDTEWTAGFYLLAKRLENGEKVPGFSILMSRKIDGRRVYREPTREEHQRVDREEIGKLR